MKLIDEQLSLNVIAHGVELQADVVLPLNANGLVVFAHGSGSSRHSRRNRFVASEINELRIGTMLIDLLTAEEGEEDEQTANLRFDIPLLTSRLVGIADWIGEQPTFSKLPLGYFGASTGAAAALQAAAHRPQEVRAVVSRGGRPDLAGAAALRRVTAPTLFIVGGEDRMVLDLNRQAISKLPTSTVRDLQIIPGATHLFEEPGTLSEAARLAGAWFLRYLKTE